MKSLYVDPLTGMPNLFGLIECDMAKTFGNSGVCLFIDLMNLSGINKEFGMAGGDAYLTVLSEILETEVFQAFPEAVGFRAGGDTFIIRFPGKDTEGIRRVAERVHLRLKQSMTHLGSTRTGIHHAEWVYDREIEKASILLQQCSISIFEGIEGSIIDPKLPRWAEYTIGSMFDRVKETLALLEQNHLLAHLDDVSGLPNHRAAERCLKQKLHEYQNQALPYSLLFIDGDNLKRYNELGYDQGNQMIKGIAELMSDTFREKDQIFRWLSGDEFLVVLDGASPAKAAEIAERVRSSVEKGTLAWQIPVTISIGISSCPEHGELIDQVVSKAEKANAEAKQRGKNRIVLAEAG